MHRNALHAEFLQAQRDVDDVDTMNARSAMITAMTAWTTVAVVARPTPAAPPVTLSPW